MIKSEKGKVILKGTKIEILTELSMIIENLLKDFEEEKIMFAVNLGLAGDDVFKKICLAKEEIERIKEKKKNEKDTKEDNI